MQLACALIQDNGRTLFLQEMVAEKPAYCLPSVVVKDAQDPVAAIKQAVFKQTGIDANIGRIQMQGLHNLGSRKRKWMVPALAFSATAKNYTTKAPSKWIVLKEAGKLRLTRQAEWLRAALA